MPRAPRIPTLAAVATEFSVSETTVYKAKRRFRDFPEPNELGYLRSEVEAFCKRNSLWHHRPAAPAGREELQEILTTLTLERTANLRITNQRLLAKQAVELNDIVRRDEVVAFYAETKAATLAASDEMIAEVEQLLAAPPTAESYQAMRESVLRAVGSIAPRRMEKLNSSR